MTRVRRPGGLAGVLWVGLGLALATAAAVAPVAGQCAASSELWWSAAPLFVNDTDGRRGLGGEALLSGCRMGHDLSTDFPRSYYLTGDADLMVFSSSLTVPQALTISGAFGWSVSLAKVNPVDTLSNDPDADTSAGARAFDYGFLGVGGYGRFESSADRKERAVLFGAEFRYANPMWPFAPSLVATWDWVKPTSSRARAASDLGLDSYDRWTVRGYWLIPVRSVTVEVDAAAFGARGLPSVLDAQGWDSGEYVRATLVWQLRQGLSRHFVLNGVTVAYADGQLPTAPANRHAVTVGVEVGSR
ncbi:MAG TPA: hypothetical protein VJ997_14585 [Longimicrobiales bacterium]|nr:hypothetical protein [Longimicrobiales bacterium]